MTRPPPSGPHSDLTGVNRDARVNTPTTDAKKGSAESLRDAEDGSIGQPDEGEVSGKR